MDWDKCNHQRINQFGAEARRWATSDKKSSKNATRKGVKTQPAKRKKSRKN